MWYYFHKVGWFLSGKEERVYGRLEKRAARAWVISVSF
jgi:hypothetical protein